MADQGRRVIPEGMTEEARARWSQRIFERELATDIHRDFVADLPSHPWPEKMIAGTPVSEIGDDGPDPEPVIETGRARPWKDSDGKLPPSANGLIKAAQNAYYETVVSWSHQERRGSNGKLLKVPEADVCTVLGRRSAEESFLASWERVDGKWKVKDAMVWAPGLAVQPLMTTVTKFKKEYLS